MRHCVGLMYYIKHHNQMGRSLIGTEVHEALPLSDGAKARLYILEKWRTDSGYELCVLRTLSQDIIILADTGQQEGSSELLTTYIGRGLESLLMQARSDLNLGLLG